MSYVIRFFSINHYSIDIKKHVMAINFIISNKNIEQFVDKVYFIQYYVIKFVTDLRQVVGFLRVLQFPPLKKLTATK
jgi:hypothetical protein